MNKKGFTLLEMMVVVMIIAVLLLLTIPNITKVIGIVDDKACKAQCELVESAATQYRIKYDEWPNSVDDLVTEGLLDSSQTTCSNGSSINIDGGDASAN